MPMNRQCHHDVRSRGSGRPWARQTTQRTAAPRPMRTPATVVGVIPATATLMNRNDQPQMKARRTTRRIRPPYRLGKSVQGRLRNGGLHFAAMPRSLIERRLTEVHRRLQRAREELSVVDEQLAALVETAGDARMRALVSETP